MSSEREGTVREAKCPTCDGLGVDQSPEPGRCHDCEGEGTVPAVSTDTLHTCERGHEHPPPVTRCGCGAVLCPDGDERLCAVCTAQRVAAAEPSDEAIEEMARLLYKHDDRAWIRGSWESDTEGLKGEYRAQAHRWLIAAYAIDMPRREAEVRAEERAATLHESRSWLQNELRSALSAGDDDHAAIRRLEQRFAAHFNPEAEHGPIGAYATLAVEEAEAEREAAADFNPEAE